MFRSWWNYLFCWFNLSNLIESFHSPQIRYTSMSRRILIFIMDRASNYTVVIWPNMGVTWKGKELQWRIRFLSIRETLRFSWLINISTYMQMYFFNQNHAWYIKFSLWKLQLTETERDIERKQNVFQALFY